jgi:hypothetical protein
MISGEQNLTGSVFSALPALRRRAGSYYGTLKTEYAFHQVRSELFPREPSQGFATIDRSSRHSFVLTLQSAGSEKNQLQMPGLHPAAARMWERIQ